MSIGLHATHNHQQNQFTRTNQYSSGNGRIWNGAISPSISPKLESMDLDELQSIKTEAESTRNLLPGSGPYSHIPFLISTTMYILYTNVSPKFCKTKTPRDQNTEIEMSRVHFLTNPPPLNLREKELYRQFPWDPLTSLTTVPRYHPIPGS
ncbi:hypothetical protein JTB14_023451 [Gonioctena quinquepunctata]|nr:hypothetical protein JTB14_023451 [Gonioctena quinquepunctata]